MKRPAAVSASSGSIGAHDHRAGWPSVAVDYEVYDVDRELRITMYDDGCVTWSSASSATPEQIVRAVDRAIERATQRLDRLQAVKARMSACAEDSK